MISNVQTVLLAFPKGAYEDPQELQDLMNDVRAAVGPTCSVVTSREDYQKYADHSAPSKSRWPQWAAEVAWREDPMYGGKAYDIVVLALAYDGQTVKMGNADMLKGWHQRAKKETSRSTLVYWYDPDLKTLKPVNIFDTPLDDCTFKRGVELVLMPELR